MNNGTEIIFEIKKHIGVIEAHEGWKKEVNIVAWNGGAPKIDIRSWSESHEQMTRGITLTDDEARALALALIKHYAE